MPCLAWLRHSSPQRRQASAQAPTTTAQDLDIGAGAPDRHRAGRSADAGAVEAAALVKLLDQPSPRQASAQDVNPGGVIHIADYSLQRDRLMRVLFRNGVQRLDGIADTAPNARGVLPELMTETGFDEVRETRVFRTPSGSISLFRGPVLEAASHTGGTQ